jgi:hypothetical protein
MSEKLSREEIVSENELSRLREELEAAEAEEAAVRAERDRIMGDIIAGREGAAKNFNNYFERLKQANQKAIAALLAWGDAAAKFYKLED